MRSRLLIACGTLTALTIGCGASPTEPHPPFVGDDGSDSGAASGDSGDLVDAGRVPVVDGADPSRDAEASLDEDLSPDDDAPLEPAADAEGAPVVDTELHERVISASSCLDGITNYKDRGKFAYKAVTYGSVKMWVPQVPAGCKVPVVHFANGTTASCFNYAGILKHLASHGFLATCYEDPNTGRGTQCITALETAMQKYPNLVDDKIGSTGHSQGGGAAIICVSRAEAKWGNGKLYAGHSIEPASGFGEAPANWASFYASIKSPIFMFNGSLDKVVPAFWVGQAFAALDDSTEAYWYEATGATHVPIPTSWSQESAVVWFRWKLLGDKNACEYFKRMPASSAWNTKKSSIPLWQVDC